VSIGDFPAEEKAQYFIEFIKLLSPEEKATLAEETDFYVAKPKTEPIAIPQTIETKRQIILTLYGKPIGKFSYG
jgi:hypothetical protein